MADAALYGKAQRSQQPARDSACVVSSRSQGNEIAQQIGTVKWQFHDAVDVNAGTPRCARAPIIASDFMARPRRFLIAQHTQPRWVTRNATKCARDTARAMPAAHVVRRVEGAHDSRGHDEGDAAVWRGGATI